MAWNQQKTVALCEVHLRQTMNTSVKVRLGRGRGWVHVIFSFMLQRNLCFKIIRGPNTPIISKNLKFSIFFIAIEMIWCNDPRLGMSGLFHCLEVERCKDSGLMSADVGFRWMLTESQGGVVPQPILSQHVSDLLFLVDAAALCSVSEYHFYDLSSFRHLTYPFVTYCDLGTEPFRNWQSLVPWFSTMTHLPLKKNPVFGGEKTRTWRGMPQKWLEKRWTKWRTSPYKGRRGRDMASPWRSCMACFFSTWIQQRDLYTHVFRLQYDDRCILSRNDIYIYI